MTNGLGDRVHRGVLADHPAMQVTLERLEPCQLGGDQFAHRDAGARGHDMSDIALADDRFSGVAGKQASVTCRRLIIGQRAPPAAVETRAILALISAASS